MNQPEPDCATCHGTGLCGPHPCGPCGVPLPNQTAGSQR